MTGHKQKPRFKRTPETGEKKSGDQELDKFASQAEVAPGETEEPSTTVYPWEEVNPKRKKTVPLYLSEDVYEKLRYLSENTDVPQQKIMRNALVPEIERQLNELLKKKSNE